MMMGVMVYVLQIMSMQFKYWVEEIMVGQVVCVLNVCGIYIIVEEVDCVDFDIVVGELLFL